MPTVGVAWIKLLDLPAEYKQFIVQHQVEQVVLYGVGEKVVGESYARKIVTEVATKEYGPNTVYVLYPNGGSSNDEKSLAERVYGFKSVKLEGSRIIADWESGIIDTNSMSST